MSGSDSVYLDVRWREEGWCEAMRVRLLGWLPEKLVVRGVDSGVLEVVQGKGRKRVALTARGIALTEPGPHSCTSENCWQLAQVLKIRCASEDWEQEPNGHDVVQADEAPLNEAYRDGVLTFLRPIKIAKDT